MSSVPNRPVLRYHGGKWMLAPWIIAHLPPHRIYVEPFGGAASVLLRKPRSYSEVYNDLDNEIVNLFRILREPATTKDLINLLRLTPFSRQEFEVSYEPTEDAIEQARRTVFRSFAGFGSAAACGHNTGFRGNSTRSGTTPAHDWANFLDCLTAIVERLRGVIIENRPAAEVIRQHDRADCLHYVDPPYPLGTRTLKGHYSQVYRHEMTDDEHLKLAALLRSVSGMVVISGYPCELYDKTLYWDWHRIERRAHADGARDRTEVLWLNTRAAAAINGRLDFEEAALA